MTTDTVDSLRSGTGIDCYCCRVAMTMTVEVSSMTLSAGATETTINRGIAIAVNTDPATTVGGIMAGSTGSMNCGDPIPCVAVDTECGGGHCGRMVVSMSTKVSGVAFAASGAPRDSGDQWSSGKRLYGRRCGMAVGAGVIMDQHRTVGWMAKRHAGRIVKHDAKAGSRMIRWDMRGWGNLIPVAGQAVNCGVVGVHDDVVNRGAGGGDRVGVTRGVMAGAALAVVGGEDIWPVHDRVAMVARLRIGLAKVANTLEHGVINNAAG